MGAPTRARTQPAEALGGVPWLPAPALVRGACAALLSHCAVYGIACAAFVAGAGPRPSLGQLEALARALEVAGGRAPGLARALSTTAPAVARAALRSALEEIGGGGGGGGMHV